MKFVKINDFNYYVNVNCITEIFRNDKDQPCIELLNKNKYVISEKAYNSLLKL